MAFQRALEIRLLTELLGGSPMLPFLSCRAVLCLGARADTLGVAQGLSTTVGSGSFRHPAQQREAGCGVPGVLAALTTPPPPAPVPGGAARGWRCRGSPCSPPTAYFLVRLFINVPSEEKRDIVNSFLQGFENRGGCTQEIHGSFLQLGPEEEV